MKTYEELMGELDRDQLKAATIETNAVVAAGAGSGKTRVLAARYVHLVAEKGIPVDEILALTFTRKAASEMYERIHGTLKDLDHPAAAEALKSFHHARIDTIDAFCNSVVRTASRRYGVAPDFSIDDEGARELARRLALPFFLERRSSKAVRQLMQRYSFAELPERLLAQTAAARGSLSSPPDFIEDFQRQKGAVFRRLPSCIGAVHASVAALRSLSGGSGKTWEALQETLSAEPDPPEGALSPLGTLASFGTWLGRFASHTRWGNAKNDAILAAKELLGELKEQTAEYLSLVNFVANEDTVEETLRLLTEFTALYGEKKREAGILTFADAARMAVDALAEDPELRSALALKTRAIMIDEFQDDNQLQRDLLFLLAAPASWRPGTAGEIPGPADILPDRLFFVGDEKQSIYRFRGADVSVFRSLEQDLEGSSMPVLGTNYRSETPLIEAFNALFPGVFENPALYPEGRLPLYEAAFSPIAGCRLSPGVDSGLHLLLVRRENFGDDGVETLSAEETEAEEVACRIEELLRSGFPLPADTPGDTRPITYSDVAILFRTTSRQHLFEKRLRLHGIPYQTESLTGLFADAPVNDLYALLRTAVYPGDTGAYAALLRSPLGALDDRTVTIALLEAARKPGGGAFCESTAELLEDPGERERFLALRRLWEETRDAADRIPSAELVTRLWYKAGYRYEILRDPSLHRFAELYDYFFELARQADQRGDTLAAFLDRIFELMESGERVNDLDIPVEKTGGVRLMTVHKSKGLEFPVVFVVNADNPGRNETNADPVYYSAEYGLTVNTGASEEAPEAGSNWFWERVREEERNKADAELRRLLYVAMTRAETRLYVSACAGRLPQEADLRAEPIPADEEELRDYLAALMDKKETNAKGKKVRRRSFLELLEPALASGLIPHCSLEDILPRYPAEIQETLIPGDFDKAFAKAAEDSQSPAGAATPRRRRWAVTALAAAIEADEGAAEPAQTGSVEGSDEIDELLRRLGMSSADFGTLAHREIEARLTGVPSQAPAELRPLLREMADRFLESTLGQRALQAERREPEYAFATRWIHRGEELIVTGQMDLLFVFGGKVWVVDFKTDRREEPRRHSFQLSVYRKAAADLFGLDVETRLFYLRSGREVPGSAGSQDYPGGNPVS